MNTPDDTNTAAARRPHSERTLAGLPILDGARVGFGTGPWEVFQDPTFAEIFCRHHRLSLIELHGTLVYAKRRPLLGVTRAAIEGPEARARGGAWTGALDALRAGLVEVSTTQLLPELEAHRVSESSLFAFVIDLRSGLDGIWTRLDKSCRNAIRRGHRAGLRVRVSDSPQAVHAFVGILDAAGAARPGYQRPDVDLVTALVNADRARLLIVEDRTRIVGGTIYLIGRHVHGWLAAFAPGPERHGSNLLYWEGIRWAAANGYGAYDFGVQSLTDLPGVVRFKRSFNPTLVPAYRYRVWGSGSKSVLMRLRSRLPGA